MLPFISVAAYLASLMVMYMLEYYLQNAITSSYFQYSISSVVCFFWTAVILFACFEWQLITLLVTFQAKHSISELGVLKSHFQNVEERYLVKKYTILNTLNLIYHILKIVIPGVLEVKKSEQNQVLRNCDYVNITYLTGVLVFMGYVLR
jgi:hypothetical protein